MIIKKKCKELEKIYRSQQ